MKKIITILLTVIIVGIVGFAIFKFVGKGTTYLNIFTKELDKKAILVSKNETDGGLVTTYKYGNYVIKFTSYEGGGDVNDLVIYINDEEVYTNSDIKTGVIEAGKDVEDMIYANPIIVDGKLYFLAYSKNFCTEKSEEELLYNLDLNNIDLTKESVKVNKVKTYLLHIEGQLPDCEE